MKMFKKIIVFCLIGLASSCTLMLQSLNSSNGGIDVPALTPAQLEDSLRLSKEELELENALLMNNHKADLNTHMDSVKTPIAQQQTKSPLSSAFENPQENINTQEASSENESPDATVAPELVIDDEQPEEHTIELVSKTPKTAPAQKRNTGVISNAKPAMPHEDDYIEFNFEDTDLKTLISQISELFKVTFISDDALSPLPKGAKKLEGNQISFKTNKPLTKKQAWNIFVTFLGISELALVIEPEPNVYRIVTTTAAQRSPIPTYIGVKPTTLPETDQLVRYLYFVENIPVQTIQDIINSLRSPASTFIALNDLNAFVLTDRSQNIRSLMQIVTELDRVTLPQSMSVLKLRRADADTVKKLYDSILSGDQSSITARLFPARKESNVLYFSENVRVIAEKRTNALILLGPQDAIKKLEEFITKFVDIELGEETFSPLRVYQLKYAEANTIVPILTDLVKFGQTTPAGQVGGLRAGDKYFKPMSFTAEASTNSIIVKGDEEDWLRIKEIIANIDTPQSQIAVEMLILTVTLDDNRELGTQLRTKTPGGTSGLTGPNVKYQTSGIAFGGNPNSFSLDNDANTTGVQRLLGNLVSLANGAGPGNTVVTLGNDAFGVWGIFNVLQKITNIQVVSNPFLIATNNQKAHIEVGDIRRVVSSTVISGNSTSTNSFSDNKAALVIDVTPQINSDGMIVLALDININEFTQPTQFTSATKTLRQVKTTTTVADKEILALGGLVKNTITTNTSELPILGRIPIIGWLFKNKQKEALNQSLLILISSQIIPPDASHKVLSMTKERVNSYYGSLNEINDPSEKRDIINRSFFASENDTAETLLDDFIFKRSNSHEDFKQNPAPTATPEKKNKKRKRSKNKAQETTDTGAPIKQDQTSLEKAKEIAHKATAQPSSIKHTATVAQKAPITNKPQQRRSLSTLLPQSNEDTVAC